MSVEKHLLITGTSTISWKDAIVQTISEASKTIDYLTGVKILDQKAKINGKKIKIENIIPATKTLNKVF